MNLKQLLGLCEHKWDKKETTQSWELDERGKKANELPEMVCWIMQCEKCGEIKKIRVTG